jgi:hypothetical protein
MNCYIPPGPSTLSPSLYSPGGPPGNGAFIVCGSGMNGFAPSGASQTHSDIKIAFPTPYCDTMFPKATHGSPEPHGCYEPAVRQEYDFRRCKRLTYSPPSPPSIVLVALYVYPVPRGSLSSSVLSMRLKDRPQALRMDTLRPLMTVSWTT